MPNTHPNDRPRDRANPAEGDEEQCAPFGGGQSRTPRQRVGASAGPAVIRAESTSANGQTDSDRLRSKEDGTRI